MKYTIEDLREGRCAVKNDGTLEELREVIKRAFPNDCIPKGQLTYYKASSNNAKYWISRGTTALPTQSVKDFLKPKSEYPKIMWVSEYPKDGKNVLKYKNVVFMKKKGKYLAWNGAKSFEEAKDTIGVCSWNYAWDIEEEPILELTIEEIAEKFNVSADKIKIKK